MKSILLAGAMAMVMAGCAQKSEKIEASYVSTSNYDRMNCRQIRAEATKVTEHAGKITGVQNSRAKNDAVATGVALVLLWPAAFFIKGDKETAAEVASLKGQLVALKEVSERKKCGIVFQEVVPVEPVKPAAETKVPNQNDSAVV